MNTASIVKKHGLKILIVFVFLVFTFIVIRHMNIDFSAFTMDDLKSQINSYGVWSPIAFIALYQLRPFILLPSTLFTLAAGAIWGWTGLVFIMLADVICAAWEFFAARYVAHDTIRNIVGERMKKLDDRMEANAFMCVFLIRLIPNVALDIQNLAFGLTKIKFSKYILATFLGLLPGKMIMIYFGDSFLDVFKNPSEWWKILIPVLLSVGMYLLLRKKVSCQK
ncbi:MAG: TVP38/TMEM64 family protein [Candidatus Omnitrophica bacterium]|nr:TVP38/TMEM64 family protein [Candidatus Omnitrophota bacterium]